MRKRLRESKEEKGGLSDTKIPKLDKLPSRSSKHAPAAQSSKYAVSRKRIVVEPANTFKPRDPRFDLLLQDRQARNAKAAATSKNYGFLNEYQDSEMAALRTQIQKTKDPTAKAELKKTLMSMENRRKAVEAADLERDIVRRHRKKEMELIREGKKERPWFLKKGDVRKEALVERFKGMKEKEREKFMARRRKRKASREKKGMPTMRRVADD
jgi:ribosomal RNA-processing protein 36